MASTISAGTTTTTALVYTADTSGVLQLQTNGTTTAVTIDTSQNIGFGVTPSSWSYGSGGKALEFPDAGAIWTYSSSSGINFSQNVYYNGAYYYKNTGAATLYGQGSGSHIWYNAVSGTGGTTFSPTQAMTLDNSGNLLINTTTANGKATVAVNDSSSIQNGVTIQGTSGGAYGGYLGWSDVWSGDSYRGLRAAIIGDVPSANAGRLRFFVANSSALNEVGRFDNSGNLLVGTTTAGSTTNTIKNVSGIYTTVNSNGYTSFSNSTATTIFTMANISAGQTWLVTANIDGQTATAYRCVFIVTADNTSTQAVQLVKGNLSNISVSGLNVQYTQSSGGTQANGVWSALRLS
jgi:hypothetical protein